MTHGAFAGRVLRNRRVPLRVEESHAPREPARNGNAPIYVGCDKLGEEPGSEPNDSE